MFEPFSENAIESPIAPLLTRFASAPALIAPERMADVDALQAKHRFRITLDHTKDSFLFSVNTSEKRIWIGLAVLERLWCYCYSFHCFFDKLRHIPAGTEILLKDHPQVQTAHELMALAYDAELKKERMLWPERLPSPAKSEEDADTQSGTALFLYVSSFMLLHEIAHIELNHPTANHVLPEESVRQEFEADRWAAAFTLDHWTQHKNSPKEFIARANGISTALCLLSTVELGVHPDAPRTHPKIPDRLLDFFNKYVPDTDAKEAELTEFPKYFAGTVLYAFMVNRGIKFDYKTVFPNFFDLLLASRSVF